MLIVFRAVDTPEPFFLKQIRPFYPASKRPLEHLASRPSTEEGLRVRVLDVMNNKPLIVKVHRIVTSLGFVTL